MEGEIGPGKGIDGVYRPENDRETLKTGVPAGSDAFSWLRNIILLPADILLQIFDLLESDYIKEFFLYWPPTRSLVVDRYYSKELHCIVSPLGFQQHVCVNKGPSNAIYDLFYYGEIDDFFANNPDIIPNKLLFVTGTDFYSLYDLFQKYHHRFLQSQNIEIIMEGCKYSLPDLKFVLSTGNISRLQLARFKFKQLKLVLNECLPKLTNLSVIQFLGHDVNNWADYSFPPNLNSLDCSWNRSSIVLGMPFNENLQELYLNGINLSDSSLPQLLQEIPASLKILMLTYNSITEFPCGLIPNRLEKLDILHNKLMSLVSDTPAIFASDKLTSINLGFNLLTDSSLSSLSKKSWPQRLHQLNVLQNKILDLYHLNNLPDSLKSLDLFANDIRFKTENNVILPFKFPYSLSYLVLDDNRNLISDFQDSDQTNNQIIFPNHLRELNLGNCGLKTLRYFKFPISMRVLHLSYNYIEGNGDYEYEGGVEIINIGRRTLHG